MSDTDPKIWLRYVVASAIVLGMFFRFYHLDRKTFWEDEIIGTIHALGYSEAEIVEASPRLHDAAALQAYFRLPDVAHGGRDGLNSTVRSLAAEDPQHPPIYYVLSHLWARAFGTSVAAMRSLPALFGLLALVAIYGLSKELFASQTVAWLSVALLAVSPFQVLYSQEAREFTLWTVTVLISSTLLLRAARTGSPLIWVSYAASLVVSLYVLPLSALVIAGHGAYLIGSGTIRKRGLTGWFLAACAVAALAFAPWLRFMLTSAGLGRGLHLILSTRMSPLSMAIAFIRDLKGSLFDFGFFRIGPLHSSAINAASTLAAVALIGYAGFVLARNRQRSATTFLVLALGLPPLAPIAHDVFFGGGLVEQARYFVPVFLAATIALAYLFSTTMRPESGHRGWWTATFLLVLFGGVTSCILSAQAATWWNKDYERTPEVAAIVNATRRPLVVGDVGSSRALGLTYYLNPNVSLRVNLRCDNCGLAAPPVDRDLPAGSAAFSDVFVFGAYEAPQSRATHDGGETRASALHEIGIKTFPLQPAPLNMFLSPQ